MLDLVAQSVVQMLDGSGASLQDWVSELADPSQRRRPPGGDFRIELELLVSRDVLVGLDLERLLGIGG